MALGQGFRCGFLGLLHLDIVQERLEREYELSIILSVPSVRYRFTLKDGRRRGDRQSCPLPRPHPIAKGEEPYIQATMIMPDRYLGGVMKLCTEKRGVNSKLNYPEPGPGRTDLTRCPLPRSSTTSTTASNPSRQGYGSFDYDLIDYREGAWSSWTSWSMGRRWTPSPRSSTGTTPGRGPSGLREAEGRDPPAAFQDRHPGGDRRRDHRPHDRLPLPKGRDRQVLRRRHHPEAQASGEAEEGQKTDEDGRIGLHPPERLSGGPEIGFRLKNAEYRIQERLLQKSSKPSFRRKPESRSA